MISEQGSCCERLKVVWLGFMIVWLKEEEKNSNFLHFPSSHSVEVVVPSGHVLTFVVGSSAGCLRCQHSISLAVTRLVPQAAHKLQTLLLLCCHTGFAFERNFSAFIVAHTCATISFQIGSSSLSERILTGAPRSNASSTHVGLWSAINTDFRVSQTLNLNTDRRKVKLQPCTRNEVLLKLQYQAWIWN